MRRGSVAHEVRPSNGGIAWPVRLHLALRRCDPRLRQDGSFRRYCGRNVASDSGWPRRSRRGQCDGERVAAQDHERWMASNPGQAASPCSFRAERPPLVPRRAWRALRPSCTPAAAAPRRASLPNAVAFGPTSPNVRRNELVKFSKLVEQFFNEIKERALISHRAPTHLVPARLDMLEHWLIELVGHVSGLSEAQLKQIEKSLPATKALVDLLNRARPIIEQAQSLYAEAEPLIDQAKKEWQSVGPAAQILIDVISHHVNRGSSPAEAAETVRAALNGSKF